MRVKDEKPKFKVGDYGITPAGAGKRESEKEDNADSEDHPRRCG